MESNRDRPLTFAHFWDRNPLIPAKLEHYTPFNRMVMDALVCGIGLAAATGITIMFMLYVYDSNWIALILFAASCWYFPGGWWGRWAVARLRFNTARRKLQDLS